MTKLTIQIVSQIRMVLPTFLDQYCPYILLISLQKKDIIKDDFVFEFDSH